MKQKDPSKLGDLSKLLGYYLACVEEEDKRSLQVGSDPKYGQFIHPQGVPGALFKGEAELSWKPGLDDRRFLEKYSLDVGKQRFLYGYPLFADRDGYLSPLFFSEAEVDFKKDSNNIKVRLPHPGNLQLNLHLFRWSHPMALERMELQDQLEAPDFGTIEARITAALARHGQAHADIAQAAMPDGSPGWKNQSILFRDTGASFTAQLRRELSDLKNRPPSITGTALGALLGMPASTSGPRARLLEVAPLNPSQRKAVEAALSQPITVITGPPGTGKSQVVVAMLASLGAAGQAALFASKNNQAVDVVRERLSSVLGNADWFLRLGNKNNIDEELTAKISESTSIPSPERTEAAEAALARAIAQRDGLETLIQQRASLADQYIDACEAERANLTGLDKAWQDVANLHNSLDRLDNKTRGDLERVSAEIGALGGSGWPGLIFWIKRLLWGARLRSQYYEFLDGLRSKSGASLPPWESAAMLSWQSLSADCRNVLGLARHNQFVDRKRDLLAKLTARPSATEAESELSTASLSVQRASTAITRAAILGRLHENAARVPTLLKEYWDLTQKAAKLSQRAAADIQADFGRSAKRLLGVIPGFVVTSLSARRSIPLTAGLFECIILDESSQCDIASALPLLLRAKRLVIIGDPKQLRHISSIPEQAEQRIAADQDATSLLARYSYRTKSLYDCAAETLESRSLAPIFLEEHYRSHPEIIEFSNRLYYERRLIVRAPGRSHTDQAVFWHDVPSQVADGRGSLLNLGEAQAVRDLVIQIVQAPSFQPDWSIGIVTPYKRQRDRLEKLLKDEPALTSMKDRLRIGTVHAFQGAEADVMVFSPVVTKGVTARAADWISREEGLLNVALTRARRALHIVGDKAFCEETPGPLGELAKFVSQRAGARRGPQHDNEAIAKARSILTELGAWFQEEVPENTSTRTYYLDFVLVGLSGTRYNIEIDGRQHYFTQDAIAEDAARDQVLHDVGYRVLRLQGRDVLNQSGAVKELLGSLI